MPTPPGSISLLHQRHALRCALLVLLGLLAYSNTFKVPFVFDDTLCLTQNPVIENFWQIFELDQFRQLGIDEDLRNSMVTRWVSYATFALNHALHGYWLPGFHAINLLLHLTNACLIYFLFLEITAPRGSGADEVHTQAPLPTALVAALLFVAHPIATSAVTYTVQRFAVLATFFSLLTLLSYRYAAISTHAARRRLCYGGALATTVLAMYSKEIAFVLPLLLALYDLVFLAGSLRQRARRLVPFLLLMLLLPITVFNLAAISAVTAENGLRALDLANLSGIDRVSYAITQLRVVVTYLRLLLWPAQLNVDYDYPLFTSLWQPAILWSALLLLLMAGSCLLLLVRFRHQSGAAGVNARLAGFGLAWFFLTLSMESSFIPLDDLIFEYRLYLPAIGIYAALSALLSQLARTGETHFRHARALSGTAVLLVVLALASATFLRNHDWRDAVSLWEDTVRKSPDKARPHINLANTYFKQERYAEAVAEVRHARVLGSPGWIDHFTLATLCNALGLIDEAIEEIQVVIARVPQPAYYQGVLGMFYLNRGDRGLAIATFETALRLDPRNDDARTMLEELRAARAGESAGRP